MRGGVKDSVIFKGWPRGICPYPNEYMATDSTNWTWQFFFLFEERANGGRVDLGGLGSTCDQGALCEAPK